MPPHRRSQGDAPPTIVPQPAKRASKRKPKPTARVRDAEALNIERVRVAEDLNEANSESNIEPNADVEEEEETPIATRKPSTKKDLLPDTRIRSTADAAADASFHGNSVEGRRAIEAHTARQSREAAAADRLRRKQAAEEAA